MYRELHICYAVSNTQWHNARRVECVQVLDNGSKWVLLRSGGIAVQVLGTCPFSPG